MFARTVIGAIVVPCVVGSFVGLALVADRAEGIRLKHPAGPFRVLAGVDSALEIGVENRHLWRHARIDSVSTSCGCVKVSSFDQSIAPRSSGSIKLIAKADPAQFPAAQLLEVRLEDGRVLETRFEVMRRIPFAGWPRAAEATREGGRLVIALDDAYFDVITSALALDAQEQEMSAAIDRRRHALILDERSSSGSAASELMLSFGGSELPNWAGDIQIAAREN